LPVPFRRGPSLWRSSGRPSASSSDFLELAAFTDDLGQAKLVGELRLEQDIFSGNAVASGALDEHERVVGVEGLGEEVMGPCFGLDRGLDRDRARSSMTGRSGSSSFTARGPRSRPFREFQVGQHEADALVGEL
jgi:hypothetical protein